MQRRTLWDVAVEQLAVRRHCGRSLMAAVLHALRPTGTHTCQAGLSHWWQTTLTGMLHSSCSTVQRSKNKHVDAGTHHEALELVFVSVSRELGGVPAVVACHGALDWRLGL
jgi:hypothetical protein